MPELPEVQSFANALNAEYAGKRLARIVFHRQTLRFPFPRASLESIFRAGARMERVSRVGKQLLLTSEVGSVRVSLGMSGAFFPAVASEPRKHEHVTLHFEDGAALGFEDPRRFGFWIVDASHAVTPADAALAALVPLPREAADGTDASALRRVFHSLRVRSSTRSVKDLLMDQKYVAGVGNIYALEALFRVGVHPAMPCARVSKARWDALAEQVPTLLQTAIAHGGSSISTYRRLHGDEGNFQTLHLVYGREGEPCPAPRCGGVIARMTQGGRSSFFCPRCQRAPK